MTKPNARSRARADTRTATGGRTRWTFRFSTAIPALSDPMGEAFDYAKEFKTLDLNAVIKDLHALMTEFAGVVAGRLRSLWRPVHPHGVAQRGHLPHRATAAAAPAPVSSASRR